MKGIATYAWQNRLIPQTRSKSCWAACACMMIFKAGIAISEDEIFKSTKDYNHDWFLAFLNRYLGNSVKSQCQYFSLPAFEKAFENDSPVLIDLKSSDSTLRHMILLDSIHPVIVDNNTNAYWLKVRDPLPQNIGSNYFISYEAYHQLKIINSYYINQINDSYINLFTDYRPLDTNSFFFNEEKCLNKRTVVSILQSLFPKFDFEEKGIQMDIFETEDVKFVKDGDTYLINNSILNLTKYSKYKYFLIQTKRHNSFLLSFAAIQSHWFAFHVQEYDLKNNKHL